MASRLKDRGGGGGKIVASKPHRTLSLSDGTPKERSSSLRRTPISGKENSSSLRWSTSSMPGGKALNPSLGLEKMASGVRGGRSFSRMRGLEKGGSLGSGVKVLEDRKVSGMLGSHIGKSLGRNVKKDANFGVDARDLGKKNLGFDSNLKTKGSRVSDTVVVLRDSLKRPSFDSKGSNAVSLSEKLLEPRKGENVGSITLRIDKEKNSLAQSTEPNKGQDSVVPRESLSLNSSSRNPSIVLVKDKEKDVVEVGSKGEDVARDVIELMDKGAHKSKVDVDVIKKNDKVSDNIVVYLNSNERKHNEEAKSVEAINKYPSKLHEKLALLEGRVQRIASEIKRTKEMLDMNKQDESKLILSDIQSKISGLEKAVGQVVDGAKCDTVSSKSNQEEHMQIKHVVTVGDPSINAKALNHEELEARFFPHHKLLRTRGSLSCSMEQDQGSKLTSNSIVVSKPEGGLLSPIDQNPIALEFLASLSPDKPDVSGNNRSIQAETDAVREVVMTATSAVQPVSDKMISGCENEDNTLMANEKLDEFDEQDNKPVMMLHEATEELCTSQVFEIGCMTSTGGWFVSEGEAVLLAHDDGSCSYYDIANSEEKSVYKPPTGVGSNLWGDCWLIRAPGSDGCSGRYIVAASAGSTVESGFCSWDFYTKRIQAFNFEDRGPNSSSTSTSRVPLAPLSNVDLRRRSTSCLLSPVETRQWWYKPCGPLLVSTASRQKIVSAHDIRDGDLVMKWETNSPVISMEYTSPLQWRSRGKVIIAETDGISLWDVNSLNPQPLLSVGSAGRKVYALHVNNTDAEFGGGIRQRVSSSEVEGHDGVFCTQDSINVFDFRLPSGVGLRMSRHGATGHSIFSRGDSIFIGSTETRLTVRSNLRSSVQQFSLRKGKLVTTYALPDSSSHFHHSSITQVWGNSNLVMAISGMGLFVFDAMKDEAKQSMSIDHGNLVQVKETVGPDDLYRPTFDYSGCRALIISRDRPAMWKYLL